MKSHGVDGHSENTRAVSSNRKRNPAHAAATSSLAKMFSVVCSLDLWTSSIQPFAGSIDAYESSRLIFSSGKTIDPRRQNDCYRGRGKVFYRTRTAHSIRFEHQTNNERKMNFCIKIEMHFEQILWNTCSLVSIISWV